MRERIAGEKIDIDYESTLRFFNNRGVDKALKHKYNYVLFQDDNPDLAVSRDMQEKKKIRSILTWKEKEEILDIGCGIGRWGEEIGKMGFRYIGIDYSENLLQVAEENLKKYRGTTELLKDSFQHFVVGLKERGLPDTYDKIFVNGVMMYLNDGDLMTAMDDVGKVSKEKCQIYFKESMALEERLTLNEFYSDSLTQEYTVIYRSIKEYKNLFTRMLIERYGFHIKEEGLLFDKDLMNHIETADYYFVLER